MKKRNKDQLTISELKEIGISAPYASQLINRRRTPSLAMAMLIEQKLGVPVQQWAEGNEAA